MTSVVLVNSRVSNIDSVSRAISRCGGDPVVTEDPKVVEKADRLILPGVGSFGTAMRTLHDSGLAGAILSLLHTRDIPFLGICLGMQLMADMGYEHGETAGLGLIHGEVVSLQSTKPDERVPHIGWNTVQNAADCPLLKGIPENSDFYFVHRYHFKCSDPKSVQATTPSYGGFAAIVGEGNRFGTQFHPEKSQAAGFALFKNFLSL